MPIRGKTFMGSADSVCKHPHANHADPLRNFAPLRETKISTKVRAVPAERHLTQRRKETQRICSFVLMSRPIRCTVEGDAII